jgi:hypothetical protein
MGLWLVPALRLRFIGYFDKGAKCENFMVGLLGGDCGKGFGLRESDITIRILRFGSSFRLLFSRFPTLSFTHLQCLTVVDLARNMIG